MRTNGKGVWSTIEISLPLLLGIIATPLSLLIWQIYNPSSRQHITEKSYDEDLAKSEQGTVGPAKERPISDDERKNNSISFSTLDEVEKKSADHQTNSRTKPQTASRSDQSIPRRQSYRMVEEGTKKSSSEYTRRGQLWSHHASWHLPLAPRARVYAPMNDTFSARQGLEHVTAILRKFDVDPRRGFLPSQDPLQRLPYARYHLWEDLGDDLPKLLGARLGQARDPLKHLPVLKTDKLVTDAELRRAHLLLCLFAHAYVWGGPTPLDEIPEGIAVPLWEVSERLGMPPVLGHPSIVLYNWRRLDVEADISMENLSTLNNFFDGRDESWFYLITVEVEARGAAAVVPMMLSIDAIQRYNEEQQEKVQLQQLRALRRKSRADSNLSLDSRKNSLDNLDEVISRFLASESSHSIENSNDQSSSNSVGDDADDRRLLHPTGNGSGDMDSDADYDGDDGNGDGAGAGRNGLRNGMNAAEAAFDEEALIGELTPIRVAVYVTVQLKKVAVAIKGMCESIDTMREGCHPFIFYHRVRPFLSAWKHNPTLPHGVLYMGVNRIRQQFFGGSAAQSSLLPFLDISLGVSHSASKSNEFLLAMRDYMPRQHREFLVYLETIACVRQFVTDSLRAHNIPLDSSKEDISSSAAAPVAPVKASTNGVTVKIDNAAGHSKNSSPAKEDREKKLWLELRDSYDKCIENLQSFRTGHISLVAEYIMAQQKKEVDKKTLEGSAGGKGTGGTDLMKFLKPVRDNCGDCLLNSPAQKPVVPKEEAPLEPYVKNNACFEDIDLYRGAAYPAGKMMYTMPVNHGWDFMAQSNGYRMPVT